MTCFLSIEITSKKVHQTDVDFLPIEITSERVDWNEFDFFSIKITSKKARQNNLHFSSIKIKSKKVRPNDINFLLIKINQKSRSCCVQVDMLCSLGSARVQGIVNSLFNSYNVSKRVINGPLKTISLSAILIFLVFSIIIMLNYVDENQSFHEML